MQTSSGLTKPVEADYQCAPQRQDLSNFFSRLAKTKPNLGKLLKDRETVNTWTETIYANGLTAEQLNIGLRRLQQGYFDYLPDAPEFCQACKITPADMSIPSTHTALKIFVAWVNNILKGADTETVDGIQVGAKQLGWVVFVAANIGFLDREYLIKAVSHHNADDLCLHTEFMATWDEFLRQIEKGISPNDIQFQPLLNRLVKKPNIESGRDGLLNIKRILGGDYE